MIAHGEDGMEVIEIKKIKEKEKRCNKAKRFWIRCCYKKSIFFQFIVCLMMFLAIFGMVMSLGQSIFYYISGVLLSFLFLMYIMWFTDSEVIQYEILDNGYLKANILIMNDKKGIVTFKTKDTSETCFYAKVLKDECIKEPIFMVDTMTVYLPQKKNEEMR